MGNWLNVQMDVKQAGDIKRWGKVYDGEKGPWDWGRVTLIKSIPACSDNMEEGVKLTDNIGGRANQ